MEKRSASFLGSPVEDYDVLIIGTGMGGATLGYALARGGKKVLFCERGRTSWNSEALRGSFAEACVAASEDSHLHEKEVLARAGRWPDKVEESSSGKPRRFIPFLGSGTGGSSALYGMVLERFFPQDFTPRQNFSQSAESSLPDSWPIGYEDLAPYYEAAEKLYRVRGGADPCRSKEKGTALLPPPPLTETSCELFDFFAARGLHPYQLPSACEDVPGCRGCQGFLCEKSCKNDSVRICLEPALAKYGARLLEECEVLRLEADRDRVTGVLCRWRGHELTLRAETIVLAAGALESPRLLLDSVSPAWPAGLANDSGLVGRNLMRHYTDLYAVFPKRQRRPDSGRKQVAWNDLYLTGTEKLGTFQSFGALPPAASLIADLEKDLQDAGARLRLALFRLARPLVRVFLAWLSVRCVILASLMEDLPYLGNRVAQPEPGGPDGPRVRIEYRISDHDRRRIRIFRSRIREILKPYRFFRFPQAENNKRLAHVCGTCRFGKDPRSSVLAPDNRAHGVNNLYIVDSSFFPSSGGTNPALTIAANALRVADRLLEEAPAGAQVERGVTDSSRPSDPPGHPGARR
jgi:choline dehydrogenase-like flavoprotein